MAETVAQIRNQEEKLLEAVVRRQLIRNTTKAANGSRAPAPAIRRTASSWSWACLPRATCMKSGAGAGGGVVTGWPIQTRLVMVIANDATVKAGAFFPMTSKKVSGANIALENRIRRFIWLTPLASSAVAGNVFPIPTIRRVFSEQRGHVGAGIPQIAAIMGCAWRRRVSAGDVRHVLMKTVAVCSWLDRRWYSAIGQKVSAEELGGPQCTRDQWNGGFSRAQR